MSDPTSNHWLGGKRSLDAAIVPATMRTVAIVATDLGIVLGTYEGSGPVHRSATKPTKFG